MSIDPKMIPPNIEQGASVLIFTDGSYDASFYTHALTSYGFLVTTHPHAPCDRAALEQTKFDLILVDATIYRQPALKTLDRLHSLLEHAEDYVVILLPTETSVPPWAHVLVDRILGFMGAVNNIWTDAYLAVHISRYIRGQRQRRKARLDANPPGDGPL